VWLLKFVQVADAIAADGATIIPPKAMAATAETSGRRVGSRETNQLRLERTPPAEVGCAKPSIALRLGRTKEVLISGWSALAHVGKPPREDPPNGRRRKEKCRTNRETMRPINTPQGDPRDSPLQQR